MGRAVRQSAIRRRLPEIGCEIAADTLQRMCAREARESDGAVREFKKIERGALHDRARQIDVGDDLGRICLARLGPQASRPDEQGCGLNGDRSLAQTCRLMRIGAG